MATKFADLMDGLTPKELKVLSRQAMKAAQKKVGKPALKIQSTDPRLDAASAAIYEAVKTLNLKSYEVLDLLAMRMRVSKRLASYLQAKDQQAQEKAAQPKRTYVKRSTPAKTATKAVPAKKTVKAPRKASATKRAPRKSAAKTEQSAA